MLLGPALALLLFASPPPVPAAPPSIPQPRPMVTYDDQMRELPGLLRRYSLSEAGIRVIVDAMRSEQADIEAAYQRISEPRKAAQMAAESPHFDAKAFEGSYRRYMATQAEVWTISTDHALAMFRALPPDDQKIAALLMAGDASIRLGMPIRPLPRAGH